MTNRGRAEFSEWEMEQTEDADDGFEMEDESWMSDGQHRSTVDESYSGLKSVPNNWRKHREMLSPLEGAYREKQAEEGVNDEEVSGGDIPLDERTRPVAKSADERPTELQSGGDQFQPLEDGFGDGDTYYYDEDMTRTNRNSDPPDHETRSNTDLIFRDPREHQQFRKKTFMRYTLIITLALAIGFFVGFLVAKGVSSKVTTPAPTSTGTQFTTVENNYNTKGVDTAVSVNNTLPITTSESLRTNTSGNS